MPTQVRFRSYFLAFALGAAVATGAILLAVSNDGRADRQTGTKSGLKFAEPPPGMTIDPGLIDPETQMVRKWRKVSSLDGLLKLTPEELEEVDIAEMNLLCAAGLPGAEGINVARILLSLDGFASSVRYQTTRHRYRAQDPKFSEHYRHSENVLRAELLVQVLQEDCGVHYNLQRVRDLDFTNSKDLFIHGLMGDNGGTCSSMPVLYVAVARRLGYPMSLAVAPGHVLARWEAPSDSDDPMKQFNVEGTGYGFSPFDDEHYRNWPRKMSEEESKSGLYLRPLTAAEALAVFLTTRGHCLLDTGRFEEAREAYQSAQRLGSADPYLPRFIRQAESRIKAREYARKMKEAGAAGTAAVRQPRYRRFDVEEALRYAEALNAYNRRNMEQYTRPPAPYGPQVPQPGGANPYEPYRPLLPGQPPR